MAGGRRLTKPTSARTPSGEAARSRRVQQCRRRFLDFFPEGFRDPTYLETERAYKWAAHQEWQDQLAGALRVLGLNADFTELAQRAVRIEARTNLLFSFEKMAIRDAVKKPGPARAFVAGLAGWLYGGGSQEARFERWCDDLAGLPRRQTRVVSWPIVTAFGFVARPRVHMFLKPNVTRHAAEAYGFPFHYSSTPQWDTYRSLLEFARTVRTDLRDWRPRDMIDVQSFIWVLGSDEYD